MANYGAIADGERNGGGEKGQASRRSNGLALVALALCAVAGVAATASWVQSQPVALEQFEIVPLGAFRGGSPMMGLFLGDDAAKNLPAERVFETDGMAPQPRCPGAWCDKTPFRIYPDGRSEFGVAPNFPLNWGACNIAIQDC